MGGNGRSRRAREHDVLVCLAVAQCGPARDGVYAYVNDGARRRPSSRLLSASRDSGKSSLRLCQQQPINIQLVVVRTWGIISALCRHCSVACVCVCGGGAVQSRCTAKWCAQWCGWMCSLALCGGALATPLCAAVRRSRALAGWLHRAPSVYSCTPCSRCPQSQPCAAMGAFLVPAACNLYVHERWLTSLDSWAPSRAGRSRAQIEPEHTARSAWAVSRVAVYGRSG